MNKIPIVSRPQPIIRNPQQGDTWHRKGEVRIV